MTDTGEIAAAVGGLELVCFVPNPGYESEGHLAVPLNGSCDIEWHHHLYRPKRAVIGSPDAGGQA